MLLLLLNLSIKVCLEPIEVEPSCFIFIFIYFLENLYIENNIVELKL